MSLLTLVGRQVRNRHVVAVREIWSTSHATHEGLIQHSAGDAGRCQYTIGDCRHGRFFCPSDESTATVGAIGRGKRTVEHTARYVDITIIITTV